MTRILAISGSLRAVSTNTTLLQAAARLAPEGVEVRFYSGIPALPAFNPDIEAVGSPPPVAELRAELTACDALLLSSPEYAHGVPGALKNALDWVVGTGELVEKPVTLLNASPYSTFAQAQLVETLTVMSAQVQPVATLPSPVGGRKLDAAGMAADPQIAAMLAAMWGTLLEAVRTRAGRAG